MLDRSVGDRDTELTVEPEDDGDAQDFVGAPIEEERSRGGPRLAGALAQLRDEFDRSMPGRSKASDGWIGDTAHQGRASRHNPNRAGVVCALDVTNDPAGGCAVHAIADRVASDAQVGRTNPCLEYIVSNGRIASRTSGWLWRHYTGSNPHTKHAHFAVGRGKDADPTTPYDDTTPWNIGGAPAASNEQPLAAIANMLAEIRSNPVRPGEHSDRVKLVQQMLINKGAQLQADGDFGPKTEAAVKAFQTANGLEADGLIGPKTVDALAR